MENPDPFEITPVDEKEKAEMIIAGPRKQVDKNCLELRHIGTEVDVLKFFIFIFCIFLLCIRCLF
jgi:hypothetical protein